MIHKGRSYICVREITFVVKGEEVTFLEGLMYKASDNDVLTWNDAEGNRKSVEVNVTPDVADRCFEEEKVDHPSHYQGNIECIEVVRNMPFWKGNVIKYLWRAGTKEERGKSNVEKEIEDLQKAVWYINDRIKQLNNEKDRV